MQDIQAVPKISVSLLEVSSSYRRLVTYATF